MQSTIITEDYLFSSLGLCIIVDLTWDFIPHSIPSKKRRGRWRWYLGTYEIGNIYHVIIMGGNVKWQAKKVANLSSL